ncbi:MAG: tetratricopeptide repeat protein [Sphingobacteriaceae bacterium]|nr:tetratricopeptide repeat protein [Sphingobacteriaceae bacterium]
MATFLLLLFLVTILCFPFEVRAQQGNLQRQKSGVQGLSPPDSAYLATKKLLDIALQKNDRLNAALLYQKIGDVFYQAEALPQALTYYYKAEALFKEEGNQVNSAANLIKIGKIYFKNTSYSTALKVFQQALVLSKRERDTIGIAESCSFIGQVYKQRGDKSRSNRYFELALSEYKKLRSSDQIAYTYSRIGSVYEDTGRYPLALKYFLQAYQLHIAENRITELAGILNNIGDTYRKTGDYQNALIYTKRAEQQSLKNNDTRQLSSAYRDLAKTYQHFMKYDSAYYYSEKARLAYAHVYNTSNNNKLVLLQTLFDVQQKDSSIKHLQGDKRISEILSISIVCISILLTFLGISIVSRQRLKIMKDNALFETEKKAMALNLQNKQLHHESLKGELELRSKELTSHTLQIIQKNQFLEELKSKLAAIIKNNKRDQRTELKELIGLIDINSNQNTSWEDFRIIYENVHENFFEKLKAHSNLLTATDLRFLALLKMNLSSADIATMLGISQDSLRTTRYRIRKKLNLPFEEDLLTFIQRI